MRQGQRWTMWGVGFLVGLGVLGVGVGFADDVVRADHIPGGRAERRVDSVLGRCVPRGSGGTQQPQQPRAAPHRSARDQLGRRRWRRSLRQIRSRRSTCSWTAAAASSPPQGRAFRRLPHRAGPRGVLQGSSTIQRTQTSSAPSVSCACSPRSAATSPRRCSLYPAPMGLSQPRSEASARSSPMWIGQLGSHLAESLDNLIRPVR